MGIFNEDIMRKVFNFSAGPGMLPEEVLCQAQKEMLDWHGTGMSIMEVGHRGIEFKEVADQAEADLRELMSIPDNYHVLFLPGGATAQFAMVPINLMATNKQADYIDTGTWSKKAFDEGVRYGEVKIVARLVKENDLVKIPSQDTWTLNPNAAYLHFTPNETIDGIEFNELPQSNGVPLVADMSSNILSRPINVADYGIIYAGAQKNVGQAGVTIIIIRDDLIRDSVPGMPSLYSYALHVAQKSFYNTPPTYAWYIAGLTLSWMKRQGGVKHFGELNQRKSEMLYRFIDENKDFYINSIHPSCRSRMNVCFNVVDQRLFESFLNEAQESGLTNLRGHRSSGGMRASIYNAMPEVGVDALIDFMKDFAKRNG
jgi:phosphoserine aminotransferase